MTAPDEELTPAKRRGCLGRLVGCLAIAIGFAAAAIVATLLLAGGKTRLVRAGIAHGMAVAEVVEHARGWLSCRAHAEGGTVGAVEFQVWDTGYRAASGGTERSFATRQEMARALAAEFGDRPTSWRMTFGYTALIPKRIYFDVEFSPDGRVSSVSEIRWGTLD